MSGMILTKYLIRLGPTVVAVVLAVKIHAHLDGHAAAHASGASVCAGAHEV